MALDDIKVIAKNIKAELGRKYPKYGFSVSSERGITDSLYVNWYSADFNPFTDPDTKEAFVNAWRSNEPDERFNEKGNNVVRYIIDTVNKYYKSSGDAYHTTQNFYRNIKVGTYAKPFTVVGSSSGSSGYRRSSGSTQPKGWDFGFLVYECAAGWNIYKKTLNDGRLVFNVRKLPETAPNKTDWAAIRGEMYTQVGFKWNPRGQAFERWGSISNEESTFSEICKTLSKYYKTEEKPDVPPSTPDTQSRKDMTRQEIMQTFAESLMLDYDETLSELGKSGSDILNDKTNGYALQQRFVKSMIGKVDYLIKVKYPEIPDFLVQEINSIVYPYLEDANYHTLNNFLSLYGLYGETKRRDAIIRYEREEEKGQEEKDFYRTYLIPFEHWVSKTEAPAAKSREDIEKAIKGLRVLANAGNEKAAKAIKGLEILLKGMPNSGNYKEFQYELRIQPDYEYQNSAQKFLDDNPKDSLKYKLAVLILREKKDAESILQVYDMSQYASLLRSLEKISGASEHEMAWRTQNYSIAEAEEWTRESLRKVFYLHGEMKASGGYLSKDEAWYVYKRDDEKYGLYNSMMTSKDKENDIVFENKSEAIKYLKKKYPKSYSDKSKMASGGQVDLFEHYDQQPEELREILERYESEEADYEILQQLQQEVEAIGYTFEYGLDAEPFGLRPIGVPLNELEGYEDYESGGYMAGGGKIPDWLFIGTYPNAYIYADNRIEEKGEYHEIGRITFTPFKLEYKDKSKKYAEVRDMMWDEYRKLDKELLAKELAGKKLYVTVSTTGQKAQIDKKDDGGYMALGGQLREIRQGKLLDNYVAGVNSNIIVEVYLYDGDVYFIETKRYKGRLVNPKIEKLTKKEAVEKKWLNEDGSIYSRGGRLKSAIMRDRKYKSDEPHEQAYSRKRRPKNRRYSK